MSQELIQPQGFYTPSQYTSQNFYGNLTGSATPGITATQCALNSINVQIGFTVNATNTFVILLWQDSTYTVPIFSWLIAATLNQPYLNIVLTDKTNLNIISNSNAGTTKFPVSLVHGAGAGVIFVALAANYGYTVIA